MDESEKKDILLSLEPLFEKAEKEKLWFYCSYQALWITPKELRKYHNQGRFIWGTANWSLRNPMEKVVEIEGIIKEFEKQKINLIKKIQEEI